MKNLKITMIYRGKTLCLCHARLGPERSDKIISRMYKKMLALIFGICEKGASPLWR